MISKKQTVGLMLAFFLSVVAALAHAEGGCPPGDAVKAKMADEYTKTISNAQRIKTASKVANDAIQRCVKLLSQFKLGMTAEFFSAEALGAAAIEVVVDRACQEVYKLIQDEVVRYDPKGYVTTGKNFDIGALFGEFLEKKFPSKGSGLVNDIISETERDVRAGGFISAGEFLKKAGSDPRSVAKANQVTEDWLKRYQPKRDADSTYAPRSTNAASGGGSGGSFWQWNNSDFKQ